MSVFVVTYIYAENSDAGRDEHRPAHKDYLGALGDQGVNLCSGPFGAQDPAGALLLVRAESKDEALKATADDPFRVNGLVSNVSVLEWIPMMGPLAKEF